MIRHYFVSSSLDALDVLEQQLEETGISKPQIHVLSQDDLGVHQHENLHEVQSVMKSDVVRSTMRGAVVGVALMILMLVFVWLAGWTSTAAGWLPFGFLAVVILGFSTWEGGLVGIQKPNYHFARFQKLLANGKHILFVDLETNQDKLLKPVLREHPHVKALWTESNNQHWMVVLQQKLGLMRHN